MQLHIYMMHLTGGAMLWLHVQVWERPAIAVSHLPTGEKWAKGYDLQLRFYDTQQYPEVRTHAGHSLLHATAHTPADYNCMCAYVCASPYLVRPSWFATNSTVDQQHQHLLHLGVKRF
jgi:hypothetical protein